MTEFREILASLQNKMVEIWGEDETMRKTYAKDIEALRKKTKKSKSPVFPATNPDNNLCRLQC